MVRSIENNRLPYKTLHCYIKGVRSRGRQRKTWINVKEDTEKKNADIETAMELIQDRRKWRLSCSLIVSSADGREQRRIREADDRCTHATTVGMRNDISQRLTMVLR